MSTVAQPGRAVYLCDLRPGLKEERLRQLLGHYGKVVSLELLEAFGEHAAVAEFSTDDAVEEAVSMLNHGLLQGKTCRCLPLASLEEIAQTLDAGPRLVVEHLDPGIEARGLRDLCALFGSVLDCKVELDDEERSRGYGFVHFSSEAEAAKALGFLGGMRLGASMAVVRRFEAADEGLFTGCLYDCAATRALEEAAPRKPEAEDANGCCGGEAAPHPAPRPALAATPVQRRRLALEYFQDLKYHHVEVLDGQAAKLERLRALVETYDANQDRQMIVFVDEANMQPVVGAVSEMVMPVDVESLGPQTSKAKWRLACEGFETGNIFILVVASSVCSRRDLDIGRQAAAVVNFDFPDSVGAHLLRSYQRANATTRVHCFFSPSSDRGCVVKLMRVLEDAGHDIPTALMELWSNADRLE